MPSCCSLRAAWTRQTFVLITAVTLLGALTGCHDASVDPPTSKKIRVQVSADVGGGNPGRSIAVRAYYKRTNGDEVALPVEPATIDVSGTGTATSDVSVEVMPCITDPTRDPRSGIPINACWVFVELQLRSSTGQPVSQDEQLFLASMGAVSLSLDPFSLPSGALLPSVPSVDFAPLSSGQLPAPVTVSITSSTGLQTGTLSSTIEYTTGSGWLSATAPAGQSAVTIVPTTTLAPGRYEAVVRVTSAWMFTPVEIEVAYIIPLPPKTVTITGAGNGAGVVLMTPSGTSCTTTAGQLSGFCTVAAPHGSTVTLTPSPAVGTGFTGWSGACQGTGPCTLVMDQDRAVTATFTLLKRDLTIDVAGTGSGSITSSPAGIACTATNGAKSGTCGAQFDHPTQVTLTAAANTATSTFTGWSGACTGTGACVVTMTEARTVTATLGLIQRQLTVAMIGGGTGTVTASVGGITCAMTLGQVSGSCTTTLAHGTSVTLTPSPATGTVFTGWAGACQGTGPCTLTMDQDRATTATFEVVRHRLTVDVVGTGSGSITSSPSGISCTAVNGQKSGTCEAQFDEGTTVTLTATPGFSVTFVGWSGVCQGSGVCAVVMDQGRTVTATFTVVKQTLTVDIGGTGNGSIKTTPAGISCTLASGQVTGTCTAEFDPSAQVAVTATPATGTTFAGWSGACQGTGATCFVTMTQARSVTATFTTIVRPVSVLITGGGTGTVTSSPSAGISCTSTGTTITGACTALFPERSMVTLSANPSAGTTFAGWANACSGTEPCTFSVGVTQVLIAVMVPIVTASPGSYPLSVAFPGNGTGTVTFGGIAPVCIASSPRQSACVREFPAGTVVEITAAKFGSFGNTFLSGCLTFGGSGLSASCRITMDGARTVLANFITPAPSVMVIGAGSGSGTVSGDGGISCMITGSQMTGRCFADAFGGVSPVLTATPASGSVFAGWSGCPSVSGTETSCYLPSSGSAVVTAIFNASPPLTDQPDHAGRER